MKASRKMLGQEGASSSLLDLLGSAAFKSQPARLRLYLARAPTWGQDLLLTLHVQRVRDSTHRQGPIRLEVRFCAQALLHGGGTREPLWKQAVHLDLDFGQGAYETGLRRLLQRQDFKSVNWAGLVWPDHRKPPAVHAQPVQAEGCCPLMKCPLRYLRNRLARWNSSELQRPSVSVE